MATRSTPGSARGPLLPAAQARLVTAIVALVALVHFVTKRRLAQRRDAVGGE
jgi:hypothetical protein